MTSIDAARGLVGAAIERFGATGALLDDAARSLSTVPDAGAARMRAMSRLSLATVPLDAAIGAMSGARVATGNGAVEHGFQGLLELRAAIDWIRGHDVGALHSTAWTQQVEDVSGRLDDAAEALAGLG
jgi:hypothetical protein